MVRWCPDASDGELRSAPGRGPEPGVGVNKTMRHHNNNGTEHIAASSTATLCGLGIMGAARVRSPETAARVADRLCDNCRESADDDVLMELYELADEAGAVA